MLPVMDIGNVSLRRVGRQAHVAVTAALERTTAKYRALSSRSLHQCRSSRMVDGPQVRYRINERDEITFVDEGWRRFADSNDAAEFVEIHLSLR